MRDINRIDPLLSKLGEVWKQHPDLRFGQFIINLFHDLGRDPWNIEEDEWMEILQDIISRRTRRNKMKIIFLDIDGVLNEDTTRARTKSCVIFIDQEKLLRLKRIVDTTGAKLVLSSTWRYDRDDPKYNSDFLELQEAFHNIGLDFYDFTPVDAVGIHRGMEIQAWLNLHKGDVDNYIILDDELFDFEDCGLLPRLIKTEFGVGGLTDELAQEAIDLLMDTN